MVGCSISSRATRGAGVSRNPSARRWALSSRRTSSCSSGSPSAARSRKGSCSSCGRSSRASNMASMRWERSAYGDIGSVREAATEARCCPAGACATAAGPAAVPGVAWHPKTPQWETEQSIGLQPRSLDMRPTHLAAALTLLIAGCGLGPSTTAPEEAEVTLPVTALPEPVLAAATVATNVWTTKASMPTARTGLAVGVVSNVIYAVGGTKDGLKYLTTVQAYNPATNSWSTKAPLPEARGYLNGTGTINGILYVAGGGDSTGITNTLFAYNPATNTWTRKAPMLK